jgi:hypothetical protein
VTLDEVDALIDVAIDAGALYVTAADWRAIATTPGVVIRGDGGLIYRGLPVWIGDEARVADRDEAARLARL